MSGGLSPQPRFRAGVCEDLLSDDADKRMRLDSGGDEGSEAVTVHCQGLSRRDPVLVCCGHNKGSGPSHLLFEESSCRMNVVRTEGVAANELCELWALVGRGKTFGLHLVKTDWHLRRADCHAASLPARPPPIMTTSSTGHTIVIRTGMSTEIPMAWLSVSKSIRGCYSAIFLGHFSGRSVSFAVRFGV